MARQKSTGKHKATAGKRKAKVKSKRKPKRKNSSTANTVKLTHWRETEPPTLQELHERLEAEGYKPKAWCDPPATYYPRHEHTSTEIRWIIAGSMTFLFGAKETRQEEVTLAAGDRLEVPPGIIHSATTGADMDTTYLFAYGKRQEAGTFFSVAHRG